MKSSTAKKNDTNPTGVDMENVASQESRYLFIRKTLADLLLENKAGEI